MNKKTTVILIAGGTASGKTTVSNRIANELLKDKSVNYLSMDYYYNDLTHLSLDERKKVNFDHPNSMDIDLLVKQIKELKAGKTVEVPTYDFKINNRAKEKIIMEPKEVIILDGILALALKEVRDLGDIKIFIKTEDDLRFIRRLQRDVIERGFTIDGVIEKYLSEVKPMHDAYISGSMDFADIIVPYREGNEVAIDLIATKIHSLITK